MPEIQEKHIPRDLRIKISFPENPIIKSHSSWLIDQPSNMQLSNLGSIDDALSFDLGQIGGNGNNGLFTLEFVMLHNGLKFVKICCQGLFGNQGLFLSLVTDAELNLTGGDVILAWAMLGLSPEHRIIRRQSHKPLRRNNSIPKIGLHLDKPSFSNISLIGPKTNNTWGLPKICIIGNNLHTTSLSDSNFALVGT